MSQHPNFLFLMADQIRNTSLDGMADGICTPNLRRLMDQSVLFTRAACTCPLCTPSRASLATGRYPSRCGVPIHDAVLAPEQSTFYQALRDGGYRFGMKLWLIEEIWWNRKLHWDAGKVMGVCCNLGLQWTRAQLGQRTPMDTIELIRNYPVNVVLKVETYPDEMIDRARYPKITDFTKVKGRTKALMPKKAEYQAHVKKLVREIPEDQNVFEIWNEPWQWKTLSAEDFATLANWAAEAIIEVRPNAVIGPNIYATVNEYDKRVIAAGKLRNQKMIGIHPYCSRTTEYRGFRQILRNYRDYVEAKTGKKIDFYATEFGWSTAPQGQRVTTEAGQARNTVREALELYAGDLGSVVADGRVIVSGHVEVDSELDVRWHRAGDVGQREPLEVHRRHDGVFIAIGESRDRSFAYRDVERVLHEPPVGDCERAVNVQVPVDLECSEDVQCHIVGDSEGVWEIECEFCTSGYRDVGVHSDRVRHRLIPVEGRH